MVDVTIQNAWTLYRKTGRNISQLDFRSIVQTYLTKYKKPPKSIGKVATAAASDSRVGSDVRYDGLHHYIQHVPGGKRRRCASTGCSSKGTKMCSYSDSDVFNADETGLFYKLTPDRTLHFKGEKCSNGKLSKERITVLVAANMSGSEKRKHFVIGKSKNPHCFKNVKNLPVDYYNNQKAWMTTDLFNKFLLDWDKELKKKRRKILLLIDNCPSHINLRDFEFIKVVFLPPNTTSVLQPMDQGIIQKIKTNFRKQLVLRFLQDVEENRETKISILDAIIMVHQAWEDVPATTITNCFKHSGVLGNQNEEQPSEPAETNALDEPEFLPWSESLELPTLINKDVLADYAKIDEGLHTEQDISDEDLINELDADIETDNGEEDEEEQQLDIPPLTDALRAAQLLKKFVMYVMIGYNDDRL
ncbi:tigger transposable element-derived protein 6-like [Diorhabda sublineata]|uniref:tigger transposable element-derived protein 6-like n=1 Tax=Diorhabda sublineata TaxID=1163346 RepID=UPI0024E14550|nr:tigger transposable element-derived protein 6-like [Diorhabda sublineata]